MSEVRPRDGKPAHSPSVVAALMATTTTVKVRLANFQCLRRMLMRIVFTTGTAP
jgi:hypothetical protein